MRAAPAAAELLEHPQLALLVRGRGIGLGGIERDLSRAQRIEHLRVKPGEPQSAFDMADGEPEPASDPFDVGALLDQLAEREALVGRVHRQPLEVLGERGLGRADIAALAEHEAGDLVILGQRALGLQRLQRAKAAPAGFDGVAASRLCRGHHQVLQQSAGGDIGGKLRVGHKIARSADIALAGRQALQGYRLQHVRVLSK
jgi:hypothetical protein